MLTTKFVLRGSGAIAIWALIVTAESLGPAIAQDRPTSDDRGHSGHEHGRGVGAGLGLGIIHHLMTQPDNGARARKEEPNKPHRVTKKVRKQKRKKVVNKPPPANVPPPNQASGASPPSPPGNNPPLPQGTGTSPPPPTGSSPPTQAAGTTPPPPPPPPAGETVAPITPGTTAIDHPYCPYPSGKISVSLVDKDAYTVLFGTTDTFSDLADIVSQLKAKVAPHYDPTGKCGKCIEQLDIWGHGDAGGGYISFGPDDAQIGNAVIGQDVNQNLAAIGALMCVGGKVVINECNAGVGNKGAQALQALADKIGVPVSGPTSTIKGCRLIGGTMTSYDEKTPGAQAKTPAQNSAGPVTPP